MSVYVVQDHTKYDPSTGTMVPKFDLSGASDWGDLHFLLSPNHRPTQPIVTIEKLRKKLRNFCDRDLLLLTGNPCFIGWATAVAADINEGRVRFLQWSSHKKKYYELQGENLVTGE